MMLNILLNDVFARIIFHSSLALAIRLLSSVSYRYNVAHQLQLFSILFEFNSRCIFNFIDAGRRLLDETFDDHAPLLLKLPSALFNLWLFRSVLLLRCFFPALSRFDVFLLVPISILS